MNQLLFSSHDRIVFAGDSVTDMGSASPVGEGAFDNLGQGYVRLVESLLYVNYPELLLRITNSGIGGNTSRDLRERFDRDVIRLNPDWISICIGINDVWRQFDMPALTDYAVQPEEYEANLREMLQKSVGKAKGVFLLTPYYIEKNMQDPLRKRMQEYVDICKKLSAEYSCILVDLQEMYDKYQDYRHSAFIAWDRVHPNQIGSLLMAREFLSKCGYQWHDLVR